MSTLFELVNTLHTGTVTRRLVTVPSCRVLTRSNSVLTLRREYSISNKILGGTKCARKVGVTGGHILPESKNIRCGFAMSKQIMTGVDWPQMIGST